MYGRVVLTDCMDVGWGWGSRLWNLPSPPLPSPPLPSPPLSGSPSIDTRSSASGAMGDAPDDLEDNEAEEEEERGVSSGNDGGASVRVGSAATNGAEDRVSTIAEGREGGGGGEGGEGEDGEPQSNGRADIHLRTGSCNGFAPSILIAVLSQQCMSTCRNDDGTHACQLHFRYFSARTMPFPVHGRSPGGVECP